MVPGIEYVLYPKFFPITVFVSSYWPSSHGYRAMYRSFKNFYFLILNCFPIFWPRKYLRTDVKEGFPWLFIMSLAQGKITKRIPFKFPSFIKTASFLCIFINLLGDKQLKLQKKITHFIFKYKSTENPIKTSPCLVLYFFLNMSQF